MTSRRAFLTALGGSAAAATTLGLRGGAADAAGLSTPPPSQRGKWMATWAGSMVQPGTTGLSATGLANTTYRNIVRTSIGGSSVRVRLSNQFGTAPLVIGGVSIGKVLSGPDLINDGAKVKFSGDTTVTIAPGAVAVSDPLSFSCESQTVLALDVYFPSQTDSVSWHPYAWTDSYQSVSGNHCGGSGSVFTSTQDSWFSVCGVDVYNPGGAGAVVALGASTTVGIGTAPGSYKGYTDVLANRLAALPTSQQMSVVNAGIVGNRVLTNYGTDGLNTQARVLTDVLTQSGVKAMIVWQGTDDIAARPGSGAGEITSASQLTSAWNNITNLARACGVLVFGATLQPVGGSWAYSYKGNTLREEANDWMRNSGAFNQVFDFAKVLADPSHAARMLAKYDSGDHIHPNAAGYAAINKVIPLDQLRGV